MNGNFLSDNGRCENEKRRIIYLGKLATEKPRVSAVIEQSPEAQRNIWLVSSVGVSVLVDGESQEKSMLTLLKCGTVGESTNRRA